VLGELARPAAPRLPLLTPAVTAPRDSSKLDFFRNISPRIGSAEGERSSPADKGAWQVSDALTAVLQRQLERAMTGDAEVGQRRLELSREDLMGRRGAAALEDVSLTRVSDAVGPHGSRPPSDGPAGPMRHPRQSLPSAADVSRINRPARGTGVPRSLGLDPPTR
jgi:hypothetical protein